jgi:type II secretory pathway pseudopilin PulG
MRRRGLRSPKSQITSYKLHNSQRGYMLITLMLAFALMTLALLAVLPDIKQQIRRDREDELRHRGTAYMRAIQHFYKKFGRYPSRIEDLENTNNVRFLRKRYKDPINRDPATGKERDFKLLHQTDISLNNGSLGQTPGLNAPASQPFGGQGGGQGGFGSAQGGFGATQGGLGGLQGGAGGPGSQPQQPGSAGGDAAAGGDSGNAANADENAGTSSPGSSSPSANGGSGTISGSGSGSGFNGPTLGGGPIIGVASASKDKEKSVHVFFDKDHYKDWLFIYLAQGDRGGLLVGPVQPGMQSGGIGGLGGIGSGPSGLPGQPGQGLTPNGIQPQGGFGGQTPQTPPNPGQQQQ